MKMFLHIRTPILLLVSEKRVNERELEVCNLHLISPVIFPEIFSADVFDGESITVPGKIHRRLKD